MNASQQAWVVPKNACDCHMHIFDPRFPPVAGAVIKPPIAPVAGYRNLQVRLGLSRNIIVQPSSYGTDNHCTLEALAAFSSTARGIAVVDETVVDDELMRLHECGIRGVRFNQVQKGATTLSMLQPLAHRIANLNWHIQLHLELNEMLAVAPVLEALPVPVVFDHIARLEACRPDTQPAWKAILRMLDTGNVWIKLSGPYFVPDAEGSRYSTASVIVRELVSHAPDRMLWGSDWPHTTERERPPDTAALLDVLGDWVPDEQTRDLILVDNPAQLYGFN